VVHGAAQERDAKQTIVAQLFGGGDRAPDQLVSSFKFTGEAEQPSANALKKDPVSAHHIADCSEASIHDLAALGEPPGIEELQCQFGADVTDSRGVANLHVLIQGIAKRVDCPIPLAKTSKCEAKPKPRVRAIRPIAVSEKRQRVVKVTKRVLERDCS